MSITERLFSIRGKTALVTGGGQGIGQMIARAYVEAGATVYIASRKREVCEQTAKELSEFGTCIPLSADLSTEEGCIRLTETVTAQADRLDILVNNAGTTWGAPYDEFPDEAWDRVMNLNVRGVFNLTRALTPALAEASTADDPSRVINLGSVNGISVPPIENYSYSASKAAVHFMTQVLAKKLASRHITVNALVPGAFYTKMMASTLDAMGDEIAAMSPLNRIGRPDDIGAAALYLASPGAAWLTGVLLPVDGGVSTTL
jgi:NAD(P)-dependent dehydrogenase (short-subunit alcohol dehydrogenase family)